MATPPRSCPAYASANAFSHDQDPGRVKITREARTHVRDGAFCACRDSNSAGIDLLAAPDAPRGFLQALIWSHRPWLHARIASSNPPTPTIIITRFML